MSVLLLSLTLPAASEVFAAPAVVAVLAAALLVGWLVWAAVSLALAAAGYVLAAIPLGLPVPGIEAAAGGFWAPGLLLAAGALLLYDGARGFLRLAFVRSGPPEGPEQVRAYRRSARIRSRLRGVAWVACLLVLTVALPLGALEFARGETLFLGSMIPLLVVLGFLTVMGLNEGAGPEDRIHRPSIVPADTAARLEAGGGVPARAVIDDMHETGRLVNERHELELELTVTLDGSEPYAATVTEVVPVWGMARLRKGESLAVRVDPGAPEHVVILWKES